MKRSEVSNLQLSAKTEWKFMEQFPVKLLQLNINVCFSLQLYAVHAQKKALK